MKQPAPSTRKKQTNIKVEKPLNRVGGLSIVAVMIVGLMSVSGLVSKAQAQTLHGYEISFENAVHHEASIAV